MDNVISIHIPIGRTQSFSVFFVFFAYFRDTLLNVENIIIVERNNCGSYFFFFFSVFQLLLDRHEKRSLQLD